MMPTIIDIDKEKSIYTVYRLIITKSYSVQLIYFHNIYGQHSCTFTEEIFDFICDYIHVDVMFHHSQNLPIIC